MRARANATKWRDYAPTIAVALRAESLAAMGQDAEGDRTRAILSFVIYAAVLPVPTQSLKSIAASAASCIADLRNCTFGHAWVYAGPRTMSETRGKPARYSAVSTKTTTHTHSFMLCLTAGASHRPVDTMCSAAQFQRGFLPQGHRPRPENPRYSKSVQIWGRGKICACLHCRSAVTSGDASDDPPYLGQTRDSFGQPRPYLVDSGQSSAEVQSRLRSKPPCWSIP